MHNGLLNLFSILVLLVLLPIAKTKDIHVNNVPDKLLQDDIHIEKLSESEGRIGTGDKIRRMLEAFECPRNSLPVNQKDIGVPRDNCCSGIEPVVSSDVPITISNSDNVEDVSVGDNFEAKSRNKVQKKSKLHMLPLPWLKKPKKNIVKQKIFFNNSISLPNHVKN